MKEVLSLCHLGSGRMASERTFHSPGDVSCFTRKTNSGRRIYTRVRTPRDLQTIMTPEYWALKTSHLLQWRRCKPVSRSRRVVRHGADWKCYCYEDQQLSKTQGFVHVAPCRSSQPCGICLESKEQTHCPSCQSRRLEDRTRQRPSQRPNIPAFARAEQDGLAVLFNEEW